MNSSTGFKKRSLLRPPSGLLSNQRQFLKTIDISQSIPMISTSIRTELAAIQQQINVLDKDKRIRTGQSSLEKSYVLGLKKWLREQDQNIEKEDDIGKVLKYMAVENLQAGFVKLWKILTHLDIAISKITQLQIVQLLKYDEMFLNFSEDSANGQRILQGIGKGGFNPSTFPIAQLALHREIELFEYTNQLKRSNPNRVTSSQSKRVNATKDSSQQLIEQLKSQNHKLTQLLEQLQVSRKQQESKAVKQVTPPTTSIDQSYPPTRSSLLQLEGKYTEQIDGLRQKNVNLNAQLSQSKIVIGQLETQLRIAEDQLKVNEISCKNVSTGSYEEALLEEMNKMKKGFENKIGKILQDYAGKEREMRRKQYEYKTENDKIKWEKGLLLKKFQALSV